jgi:hypothetical protein
MTEYVEQKAGSCNHIHASSIILSSATALDRLSPSLEAE